MKEDKKFLFYGKTLSYDSNFVEYNRIRYRFESFAQTNAAKIYDEYDAFGDLDKFYDKCIDWIQPYLYKSCEIAIEELGKLKFYGIELDDYFEEIFDSSAIANALEPIEKYYEALAEKKEERSAAHSKRLHSGTHLRDSYYDGGDAALSVMANTGGGIAAVGINAISSGFNFISDSIDKDDIYKKSRATVVPAIINSIGTAYFELIEYAKEKCDGFTVENIHGKDIKEANAICANIIGGRIERQEIISCAEKVLSVYPYNKSLYTYILANFGDEKLELQKIAEFFHIEGLNTLQIELLHKYYKNLNISTENKAIEARMQMAKQAAYLGIADYSLFLPLERKITDFDLSYRTVCGIVYETRELADLNKELYEFYQTLELTSTKKAALEAIDMLEHRAAELNISAEWLAPYTNAALEAIQKKAWEDLDNFYNSLNLDDESKAIAARQVMANKAVELEIDDYKSYPPLEGLIVQFDELARTAFEYRFDTRKEAQTALTDEAVFFKTVYTGIVEVARKTSAMKQWGNISSAKQDVIKEALKFTDQPLVFIDSTYLNSGKNGLAITPCGFYWNNGSALLQTVANNVVFKTLFKNKSQEMLAKNEVNSFYVSWKEFFSSDTVFSVDEKKMLTITANKSFEATHSNPEEICSLLRKIHGWGKTVKCEFSGNPVPVPPDSELCSAPELTPIPASVKINVSNVIEPFPYNTVLLQSVAEYRDKDCDLMIAPDISEELYRNFIAELDEDLQKKAKSEIAICQADHTLMFKNGKKGFLLTNEALYYHNNGEFTVELSDIISIGGSNSNLEISCADGEEQLIDGKGVDVLRKVLHSLLEK